MSAKLFSTIRTLSCKLHHNIILLLKYPDALMYLQYNTWQIFYVKICMTRWNELCGVFDSFAGRCVTSWAPSKGNTSDSEWEIFFILFYFLRYLYWSFLICKDGHAHVKSQMLSPPIRECSLLVDIKRGLHMQHTTSGAGISTDELIISGLSTGHWHACWIPSPVWATWWSMDKLLEAWRGQDYFTMLCAKALRAVLYPHSLKPLVQNASLALWTI